MDKVAFRLDTYQFIQAFLDLKLPIKASLDIKIYPSGVLSLKRSLYALTFKVVVSCKETGTEVVSVVCKAQFSFENLKSLQDLPAFFYPNSLAIIFPYVRAFISTLTLQANVSPIILPTINLMGLTDELRKNTEISE